jgi:hypothetical protein
MRKYFLVIFIVFVFCFSFAGTIGFIDGVGGVVAGGEPSSTSVNQGAYQTKINQGAYQ